MDSHIKHLLYISEYNIGGKNKKLLKEDIASLFESRKTEEMAVAYLKKHGKPDDDAQSLVNQFKAPDFDTSKNQVNLTVIAAAYLLHDHLNDLKSVFNPAGEMMNDGRLKPIEITKDGFKIGEKTYENWLKFSEYIHGIHKMDSGNKQIGGSKENVEAATDAKEIATGDGIKIYNGNDVGKCIKMTMGSLTGKAYQFCIGQPANRMWQSYRDSKTSTFYYVVDENRTIDDPLHIVVFDNTKHGIELTDADNRTGNIAEYGEDVEGYLNYLKSKGVDTDIMVNVEKSDAENMEQGKLGTQNSDVRWFKELSYEEQSKYIGRGHLLSEEQFNYLWQFRNPIKKGGYNLLNQYVSTGQAIPESQFNVLIKDNG